MTHTNPSAPTPLLTHQQRWLLGTLLIAFGLGLLIYGPTISLPLFLDDASNFRWLTPTGGLDVWRTAGGFPFYRPLPFSLFKLLWHLQGGYHAATLHALVVLLHSANAFLVGLLAACLTRRAWIGPPAAALMLVFPFSYQAVALVGSIFHLLLVLGTAGAALCALHYLEGGSRRALIAAWVLAFVGIWSHENGVVVPVLVGLVLWAAAGLDRTRLRRWALLLGPMALLAGGYFLAWLLVEKSNEASGLLWAALDAKLAYFAQGLVYPLSALIRPFFDDAPVVVPVTWIAAVGGVGTAVAALWWTSRTPARGTKQAASLQRIVVAALLWVLVAALPGALLLSSPYLLGGPRLLYLSSGGVVLFWAAWLAGMTLGRRLRYVAAAVVSAFVIIGGVFCLHRVGDYQRLGDFYSGFIQAAEDQPDTPMLLVNAPAFIAPRKGAFLLGAEGATYLLDFITLQDLVWVNSGQDAAVTTVAFPDTLVEDPQEVFSPRGPWVEWDGLSAAIGAADRVYSVRFDGRDFALWHVGDRLNESSNDDVAADYGALRLLDASASPATLTLRWSAAGPLGATVFVHALCDGQLAMQFDGAPLGGLHPFDRWGAGETWADYRAINNIPCDTGDILVGLYDPATVTRYDAALPDGSRSDVVSLPYAK